MAKHLYVTCKVICLGKPNVLINPKSAVLLSSSSVGLRFHDIKKVGNQLMVVFLKISYLFYCLKPILVDVNLPGIVLSLLKAFTIVIVFLNFVILKAWIFPFTLYFRIISRVGGSSIFISERRCCFICIGTNNNNTFS
jgi:hypothetical protein